MSEQMKVALTALVGSVLLAPLMAQLIAWYIRSRSRLVVTVTMHSKPRQERLWDDIDKIRDTNYELGDKEKWDATSKLRSVLGTKNYWLFEVENNSKKKLEALTFCAHSAGDYLQINDGPIEAIKNDLPIALGDLQPGRSVTLHVIGGLSFTHTIKAIKRNFTFSADELGRVSYKFPMPPHLKDRLQSWLFWIFLWIVLLASVGGPAFNALKYS